MRSPGKLLQVVYRRSVKFMCYRYISVELNEKLASDKAQMVLLEKT